jgi:Na+/alanine symporter
MTGPTRRTALLSFAAAGVTLLGVNSVALANAENVYGKFASFQNGVLSLTDVTGGTIKGSRDLAIRNGMPVIVFVDNHAKMGKSPDAFANVTVGQNVEVTLDSSHNPINIQIGFAGKGKSKQKKS